MCNLESVVHHRNLVEGTEQDKGHMIELNNMKNTSGFLEEKSSPPKLYTLTIKNSRNHIGHLDTSTILWNNIGR